MTDPKMTLADVRPSVLWFATVMEARLRENEHKGGWDDCDGDYLLRRLREETDELAGLFDEDGRCFGNEPRIVLEAADVANFAMMVANNADPASENAHRRASPTKEEMEFLNACERCFVLSDFGQESEAANQWTVARAAYRRLVSSRAEPK